MLLTGLLSLTYFFRGAEEIMLFASMKGVMGDDVELVGTSTDPVILVAPCF
jgi:hypothetical protein